MAEEHLIDDVSKAFELGSKYLAFGSQLKIRALYSGDHYWLVRWGAIPVGLLLGNIPFLIRKQDGLIVHELPFAEYHSDWELLMDAEKYGLEFDSALIQNLQNHFPAWETDDLSRLPELLSWRKRMILFFKRLFSRKT